MLAPTLTMALSSLLISVHSSAGLLGRPACAAASAWSGTSEGCGAGRSEVSEA